MLKFKKFDLYSPRKVNELDRTTREINEYFANKPQCKIINIEHIYEGYSASFCYICVWYSEED